MNFVAMRHKALKTDVGNVSLSMAIRQGLVGPKWQVNSVNGLFEVLVAKGNRVNIPELGNGEWLRSKVLTQDGSDKFLSGISFLFNMISCCYKAWRSWNVFTKRRDSHHVRALRFWGGELLVGLRQNWVGSSYPIRTRNRNRSPRLTASGYVE